MMHARETTRIRTEDSQRGAAARPRAGNAERSPALGNQALLRALLGASGSKPCNGGGHVSLAGGECPECRDSLEHEHAPSSSGGAPAPRGTEELAQSPAPDEWEFGPSVPMPQGATTPDGVDLGPTDTTKNVCHSRFWATTSVHRNTTTAAQGRQDITFRAASSGETEGLSCDCGCPVYRHWIKGYWRTGSPTAPKQYGISSCGHPLTINESSLREEYTSCIGDNDANACRWAYADAPGWSSGLADGTYVELHYDFVYQIWDRCQGRSVAAASRSLDISGDRAPRTITWSGG
jgi:hypothetical protein